LERARRILSRRTGSNAALYFGGRRGHEDGARDRAGRLDHRGNEAIPGWQFIFADGFLKYFVFDPSSTC